MNSGSEANELALRLAQSHSGKKGIITPDEGYFGNTTGALSISAYKFKKPNGVGQADWVEIIEIPDMPITMSDGCRLSARVWMPVDAENAPVPAILEFLPYRKRDGTTARDCLTHQYFAKRGYACIRVDMRGNGDSEGIMLDEYSKQELDDAEFTVNWLAAQTWCSGAVGMMGISWGGFNS